ncbi:MAG TPA: hypothetical protein VGC91_21110 [Pyrinomonadaceae bacterium]
MNLPNHEVRHGIGACRRRLRRTRANRKTFGRTRGLEQAANRDSVSHASEIDRRTPSRARFEVKEEANAA